MVITDLNSFSFSYNIVSGNGYEYLIDVKTPDKVLVVLFDKPTNTVIERYKDLTTNIVPVGKYQYALDKWEIAHKQALTEKNTSKPNTPEEQINAIKDTINKIILSTVESYGFSTINSIGKYVGYDNYYRSRAESLGVWIAECWKYANNELQKYKDGSITLPSISSIVKLLPQYKG